MKYIIYQTTFLILISILFCQFGFSQNCATEQYFMTQDIYPSNEITFWHKGRDEVQGVTNDNSNWYITTAHLDNSIFTGLGSHDNGTLWKIPLELNGRLGDNSINDPNVLSISMDDIPILRQYDFAHFGDPDYFRYKGVGYILLPAYSSRDRTNDKSIICFRASDLQYMNFSFTTKGAGFCFVDSGGNIYINENGTHFRKYYNVDWDKLTNPSDNSHDALNENCLITLDFTGSGFSEIKNWQGADLSDSGNRLFITSGRSASSNPSDGLHFFEIGSTDCGSVWIWRKTSRNSNSSTIPFTFLFDPSTTGSTQSPQGLTYWDIDDPTVTSELRGKLHVLLFDWNYPRENNVYFYHFSDYIHVDSQDGLVVPQRRIGGIKKPFKYFNDAFYHYPAWNGSTIALKAGTYDETGTYNECVKITSEGGSAIIGKQ